MVCGLSVALFMYSSDKDSLTYYGDAVSHLVAARKLFDWGENPGWGQIGTVWLPLPHFLLMFPSFIDGLFFSGFAGLVISLPSHALTSALLYKIIARILSRLPNLDSRIISYAAFSGALLYGVNPNFLYLGITAMTEAPFMLFIVAAAYLLLRWYEEQQHQHSETALKYLLLSSIFVSAATLCRYEGWILPLFMICFPPLILISRLRYKHDNTQPLNSAKVWDRTIAFTVLVCIISFSGIIFWLAYNVINYGDPLEFANARYYSAASQALGRSFRENLYLQPYNVMSVYSFTAFQIFGPLVLAAAAIGYFMHIRTSEQKQMRRYLYIFLGLPPLFTILTLLIGIGEMAGEMSSWFNSRFVVLVGPLLMLLVGFFIAKQPKLITGSRLLLVCVIAALFAFQLAAPTFGAVVTLADAKGGFTYKHAPFAVLTGEKIGSLYDGTGSIMIITGSAQEHRILLSSGLAFKNFDSIIESSTWKKSFYEPWNHNDKWIVIAKDPDSDGVSVVKYWNDRKALLEQYYETVFENEYYLIWKLK